MNAYDVEMMTMHEEEMMELERDREEYDELVAISDMAKQVAEDYLDAVFARQRKINRMLRS